MTCGWGLTIRLLLPNPCNTFPIDRRKGPLMVLLLLLLHRREPGGLLIRHRSRRSSRSRGSRQHHQKAPSTARSSAWRSLHSPPYRPINTPIGSSLLHHKHDTLRVAEGATG